jgi:hypothetical protein
MKRYNRRQMSSSSLRVFPGGAAPETTQFAEWLAWIFSNAIESWERIRPSTRLVSDLNGVWVEGRISQNDGLNRVYTIKSQSNV